MPMSASADSHASPPRKWRSARGRHFRSTQERGRSRQHHRHVLRRSRASNAVGQAWPSIRATGATRHPRRNPAASSKTAVSSGLRHLLPAQVEDTREEAGRSLGQQFRASLFAARDQLCDVDRSAVMCAGKARRDLPARRPDRRRQWAAASQDGHAHAAATGWQDTRWPRCPPGPAPAPTAAKSGVLLRRNRTYGTCVRSLVRPITHRHTALWAFTTTAPPGAAWCSGDKVKLAGGAWSEEKTFFDAGIHNSKSHAQKRRTRRVARLTWGMQSDGLERTALATHGKLRLMINS